MASFTKSLAVPWIGALMAALAERALPDLDQLVKFAASLGVAGDKDEWVFTGSSG